jgi:hypothetical protein
MKFASKGIIDYSPLEPGWVPTKMGGLGTPDDLKQAHLTQAWLAAGNDPKADVTGVFLRPRRQRRKTRMMTIGNRTREQE